jgi:hypothetical protein
MSSRFFLDCCNFLLSKTNPTSKHTKIIKKKKRIADSITTSPREASNNN